MLLRFDFNLEVYKSLIIILNTKGLLLNLGNFRGYVQRVSLLRDHAFRINFFRFKGRLSSSSYCEAIPQGNRLDTLALERNKRVRTCSRGVITNAKLTICILAEDPNEGLGVEN